MQLDSTKIRMALIDKCWTIKDLSTHAKVGIGTLNRIMNKNTISSFPTIGKISKALEIPAEKLLKG